MSYLQESLSKNESLLAVFGLHWWAWLRVVIWFLVGLITLPVGIGVIFMGMAIYYGLCNITEERGMTDKRVILKRGIISRNTEELKLSAVETVSIRQGVIGRIFGFGQVRLSGRGISDVAFSIVPDPMSVKRKIESYSPA